jgi:hypothetical protein
MDDLTLDADLEHHLFKTNSRESVLVSTILNISMVT